MKSVLAFLFLGVPSSAWTAPIFQRQLTAPSKEQGVEIELPDFELLFERIQMVSPLARAAIEQNGRKNEKSLLDSLEDSLKWTTIESNKKKIVQQIDKIDDFMNLDCPILRFRATLEGPCVGDVFADFIMNVNQRSQWDPAIDEVYEAYPIRDLDAANALMGFGKYGDCSRLGVGYCRTKKYLAVSAREQLTLCGIQHYESGATLIWGTEMADWHNDLLPSHCDRTTRSKSHLFCTTLVPCGENQFDVEYCLQIDIGGKLPSWITTPILVETIKGLFRHAKEYYGQEKVWLQAEQQSMQQHDEQMEARNSILMTP